jgi:hypothetical protein
MNHVPPLSGDCDLKLLLYVVNECAKGLQWNFVIHLITSYIFCNSVLCYSKFCEGCMAPSCVARP